jgi:hypothetical protein
MSISKYFVAVALLAVWPSIGHACDDYAEELAMAAAAAPEAARTAEIQQAPETQVADELPTAAASAQDGTKAVASLPTRP